MAEDYPVNIVFDAVDRVTGSMRRINSRIERMTGPIRRLNNRFRALARESGLMRLRDSLGRVGSATGRVLRQFGALASRLTMIGGLAGFALTRVVNNVAGTGDEIAKSARALGISTDFLQEYQFVAERVGVSQETLNQSFLAFGKRLGEMKSGSGRLNTLLEKTNPKLHEQLMTTTSSEEAFGLLMSAMEKIEDPSKRAALASAAFSRSGIRMTNIAQAGSEEVNRLRRRAHELGLVMDEDALEASENYQDSLTNMKSAMSGLRNIIGASLMPIFTEMMDRMTIFFVNNRENIQEWMNEAVARIPGAFADLRDSAMNLLDRLQPVIDGVQVLFDKFGTGETILTAIAAIMGGPLIAAVAAMIASFASLAVVLATTPIGWVLLGIGAIAAAIWGASKAVDWVAENWPDRWQRVSDAIGLVVDWYGTFLDLFTGNFDGVMERLRRMASTIESIIPDWLKNWLTGDDDKTVTVRDERRRGALAGRQGAQGALQSSTRTERRESRVILDIPNMPRGTRIREEGDDNTDVELGMGFAMGTP